MQNYQWRILCQLAEAAAKGNQVKTAWKTDERNPVSPGQCSCTYTCTSVVQLLLCVTVALNWLIIIYILLIWHHLFSVPQHEKTLDWEEVYRTDDEVINYLYTVEDFFDDQELLYHGNPSAATPMEEVCAWTAGESMSCMLKNKPHSNKFDHFIIASL